jgi:hypothetical protein
MHIQLVSCQILESTNGLFICFVLLLRNHEERPSAEELLSHPFLSEESEVFI